MNMKTAIMLLRSHLRSYKFEWFTEHVSIDPATLAFNLGLGVKHYAWLMCFIETGEERVHMMSQNMMCNYIKCHVIDAAAFSNVVWDLRICNVNWILSLLAAAV